MATHGAAPQFAILVIGADGETITGTPSYHNQDKSRELAHSILRLMPGAACCELRKYIVFAGQPEHDGLHYGAPVEVVRREQEEG